MDTFPLSAIVLGLINIAIWVAILLFIGVVIVWVLKAFFNTDVPADVRKWYLAIVGLYALYMLVALLFGLPIIRIVSTSGWQLAGIV